MKKILLSFLFFLYSCGGGGGGGSSPAPAPAPAPTPPPPSNQAPVISSSSSFSADENQTAIGTVTATDADGDTLTYTISGSEILISDSGVLTFASAPDYETKNSYTATVTVSDDVASVTQEIIVTIRDISELDTGLTSSCETFVNDALSNEFRYC